MLGQTWSLDVNNSVSGLGPERECQWASVSRTGRAGPGPISHSLLPGPGQHWLGQSYFVSNRLDTQSELQSVLTKYTILSREDQDLCLINETPRVCPETVSCWQWRHWHCDLLIGKFAARSGSYFHLGRLLWEKLETWSTLDSNDRSWDLLEPTLQSFSDI